MIKKSVLFVLFIFTCCGVVAAADNPNESMGTADQSLMNTSVNYDITSGEESSNIQNQSTESNAVSSNTYENESITSNNESSKYVENEVFVRFKSETSAEVSNKAHSKTGARVIREYKEVGGLQLVEIPQNMKVEEAIAEYLQNPDVLYAEPNYLCHNDATPNDPYYNYLWGLSKIDLTQVWDVTTGSSNVIIAVVDTGVNMNHPDLISSIWTNTGEIPNNGIDDDGNGYIDDIYGWDFYNSDNNPADDNGHGTHVAGIIAATGNNGMGVTGVMWNAKIMVLKFLNQYGQGYTSDAVSAIDYATKMGAHIINNSWGGSSYSQTLKNIIDASSALVACAAGNDRINNDASPTYPASFTSSNIIAVAATDQNDNLAYFSNYGLNSVDVAAPGVSILSTFGSGYEYLSGTSMATPYVSGLAGLVKSVKPEFSNLQIKNVILNYVDYIPALSGKILTAGRINAYKTLGSLVPLPPKPSPPSPPPYIAPSPTPQPVYKPVYKAQKKIKKKKRVKRVRKSVRKKKITRKRVRSKRSKSRRRR